MQRRMPADSVFAGAKFWAVFGAFRGDGAMRTAQNSGTMAKTGALFCKTTQKRVGGGERR